MAQNDIQISVPIIGTSNKPVAYADQIYDEGYGENGASQSDINELHRQFIADHEETLGRHDEKIVDLKEGMEEKAVKFDVYNASAGDVIPDGALLTWAGAPVETRIAEVSEVKTLMVACARVKENNADWPNPKQVRLLTFVLGHSLVATSPANDAKPFNGFQDEDITVAQTGYNGTPQEIYFNTVKGCFVGKTGNAIQGYTYYNSWSNDADYRSNAASNVFVYTSGQVARYYRYVENGGYVMGNITNFSQLSADLKEVWGGAQVDISGKADKSYVDGQLSGKANKSEMSITAGTGINADKTTITLKEGTSATVLTQHQDISGKVDVVPGKGLSTNDYTDADKQAVATIGNKANTSDVYPKTNTYNKTEVDNKVDVAVAGAAFLGEEEGEASVADFDPRTDTLWKKEQLLSPSEKAQVIRNLGISDELSDMQDAINEQDKKIALLDGHDLVVVDTLPTSESPAVAPDTDKIYRLVITDGNDVSYEDYMYTEATTSAIPKKIATYALPGIDDEPTAGSDNLVKSGGVVSTIVATEAIGKKEVPISSLYEYTQKDGYAINDDGYIATRSDKYKVFYTNKPVNKGAILHFTGTPSGTARIVVAISSVPITDENLTEVQLTILSNEFYSSDLDLYLLVPQDGYIAYYRYIPYWTVFTSRVCNISELQDNSVLDISELNNTSYTSLSAALAAVPDILKKGGLDIRFIQLTPATYTVVKTEEVAEQPTGTEVQEALSLNSGTYTAAQMSGVTLPTSGSVTYYLAVSGGTTTYTTWVITKATTDSTMYVQYRLTSTTWSTNVANWQGVDTKAVSGSQNLIESGAVKDVYNTAHILNVEGIYKKDVVQLKVCIDQYGELVVANNKYGVTDYLPVNLFAGTTAYMKLAQQDGKVYVAFYDEDKTVISTYNSYSDDTEFSLKIPADAYFMRATLRVDRIDDYIRFENSIENRIENKIKESSLKETSIDEVVLGKVMSVDFDATGVITDSEFQYSRVSYTKKLEKGTLIKFKGASTGTADVGFGFSATDPAELQTIEGLTLSDVSITNIDTQITKVMYEMPDDGYLFFTYNDHFFHYHDFKVLLPYNKVSLKLLAIGNSFSRDCLSYVPALLENIVPGIELTIGILYHASCSLEMHYTNRSNTTYYTFNIYKSKNGRWTHENEKGLDYGLNYEDWDIITLQQSSLQSCRYSTYSYLNDLINYIVAKCPNTKLGWIRTHTPASDHTVYNTTEFPFNQESMEKGIDDAVKHVMAETAISILFPYGTAIRLARGYEVFRTLGEELCYTDKAHLNEGLPCQIAAYTNTLVLLDYLSQKADINGNLIRIDSSFETQWKIPEMHGDPIYPTDGQGNIDEDSVILAQQIAHIAVKNPYTLSELIPDVSNFTTASVDNLVNYYLKSETYTKAEVDAMIAELRAELVTNQ